MLKTTMIELDYEKQKSRGLERQIEQNQKESYSRQIILTEQMNENNNLIEKNDKLKQEIKTEKKTNTALQADNIKLKQDFDAEKKANTALQADNDKLKPDFDAEKKTNTALQADNDKLKQDFDAEKKTNTAIQADNDKLKQDFDAEKKTNTALQADNGKLKQDFDAEKKTNTALQTDNNKLKQDFDAEKKTNTALQDDNDKLHKDLKTYRETVKSLETNTKTLAKELETSKAELRYTSDPILVHTITGSTSETREISGIAIFEKELFVASEKSSEVKVYDLNKFSLSRRCNVTGLIDAQDLVSCNRNKCLYICNIKELERIGEILRVDLNGKLILNWSVVIGHIWPRVTGWFSDLGLCLHVFYGLSVTEQSNVIFTNKTEIAEYLPVGQLIRRITLSLSSDNWSCFPTHAIKLTNDHFVVSLSCDGDTLHGVCRVDGDGKRVKSFGGKKGSDIGQMSHPSYLSVDRNGFVMVIDKGNSRVLLFEPDLEFKGEILSKEKHKLQRPVRIFLDESHGRLFVADNEKNNQRILIFNLTYTLAT